MVLCSYAGLRGAVGLALALMVSFNKKVPQYIQDVVMLHVAGVALLTLLINATTTGWLVKKLRLSHRSDLQKNILVGATYRLEDSLDARIDSLKGKRSFNNVDWSVLRQDIKVSQVR